MSCEAVGHYYPEWDTAFIFKKCTDWQGITTLSFVKETAAGTPLPPFPAGVKGKVNDEDLKDWLLGQAGLDDGDAYVWPQDDIDQDYVDDADEYEIPDEVENSIDDLIITDGSGNKGFQEEP